MTVRIFLGQSILVKTGAKTPVFLDFYAASPAFYGAQKPLKLIAPRKRDIIIKKLDKFLKK